MDVKKYGIRQPPGLTWARLLDEAEIAGVEIERLEALPPDAADPETRSRYTALWSSKTPELISRYTKHPPVDDDAHMRLVLTEAWLHHCEEVYRCQSCPPFRGEAADIARYVERLVQRAAQDIHAFLMFGVPVWKPKMSRPGHYTVQWNFSSINASMPTAVAVNSATRRCVSA
jgi:hypothetical protein